MFRRTLLGRCGDQSGADHGVVLVEHGRLARRDAVRRLVELEPEAATGRLHAGGSGRRAIAELRLRTLDLDEEAAGADAHLAARERRPRPDDDGVRPRLGAQRVHRLRGDHAQAAALARREAPEAVVLPELPAALVDDGARSRRDPVAREEVPIVASGEKAGLLALRAPRGVEPGGSRLVARLLLRLRPEREPEAVERARVEAGEHVGLILCAVGGAREEQAPAVLAEAGVVARSQARGADAARKAEERGEAEGPVALHARVRRLPLFVGGYERGDDGAAEPLAEVERDVRDPEGMAGRPRGDDGFRRAADALPVRAVRVGPEAKRQPDG